MSSLLLLALTTCSVSDFTLAQSYRNTGSCHDPDNPRLASPFPKKCSKDLVSLKPKICLDFQAEGLNKTSAQTEPSSPLTSSPSEPLDHTQGTAGSLRGPLPRPQCTYYIRRCSMMMDLLCSQVAKMSPRLKAETEGKACIVIQARNRAGEKPLNV